MAQSPRRPASSLPVVPNYEQTSIADRRPDDPDEVTVQFTRWCAHLNTAYQKGQFAGFKRAVAQQLVASGAAVLVQTTMQQRSAAERFMVTK